MRRCAPRRRIVALPVAIVAAFSLLLRVAVAPGVFSAPADGLLALGSICHAATGEDGDKGPQPLPGHGHEHCLLCQAGFASFVPPPSAPRLAVPTAIAVRAVPLPSDEVRGGVWPAYASRAPPAIG